jgi:hypothetical protein
MGQKSSTAKKVTETLKLISPLNLIFIITIPVTIIIIFNSFINNDLHKADIILKIVDHYNAFFGV